MAVLSAAELVRLFALVTFCKTLLSASPCAADAHRDAVRTWRQLLQILTSRCRLAEAKSCPSVLLRPLLVLAALLRVEHPADTPEHGQGWPDAPWPSGTGWSSIVRELSAPLITAILQLFSGMEAPFGCVVCPITLLAYQSSNQAPAHAQ